jgi:hypothetical protein
MNRSIAALLAVAGASTLACAQPYLMYVDSNFDEVILIEAATGDITGLAFITDANDPLTWNFQTPKEAIQVGNEVWVTDQLSDAIYRFTATQPADFIGAITGGLDNIRGLALVGNRVYVSNAGTANGAPGDAIVVYETNGTFVSSFVVNNSSTGLPVDPFDVEDFNGRLLITDIEGEDLVVCDVDGSNAQVLVNGNLNFMEFPQQVRVDTTGPGGTQEIWVNAFSSPAGVYRFTPAGVQVAYYPVTTGGRGVWPLPRDSAGAFNVLFTDGVAGIGGLRKFDPAVGTPSTIVSSSGGQYVGSVTLASNPVCNDIDVNNDGSSFDPTDIDAFLSVFSEGPCVPETATCDSIDFNNDGSLFDPCDIDSFLLVFSEGPCTLCGV